MLTTSPHVRAINGGPDLGAKKKTTTKKSGPGSAHADAFGLSAVRFGAIMMCTLVLAITAATAGFAATTIGDAPDAAISAFFDTSPAAVAVAPPGNVPLTIAATTTPAIPETTLNRAPAIQEHPPTAPVTNRSHAIAATVHSPYHPNA